MQSYIRSDLAAAAAALRDQLAEDADRTRDAASGAVRNADALDGAVRSALHLAGVVAGLEVVVRSGDLKVLPGLAVDDAGRTIALTDGGRFSIESTPATGLRNTVGGFAVVTPLFAPLPAGDYELCLVWKETSDGTTQKLEQTPHFSCAAVSAVAPGPGFVPIARVRWAGNVAASTLSLGLRRHVSSVAGEVVLVAPSRAGLEIHDDRVGALRGEEGNRVVVEARGGGSVHVAADQLTFGDNPPSPLPSATLRADRTASGAGQLFLADGRGSTGSELHGGQGRFRIGGPGADARIAVVDRNSRVAISLEAEGARIRAGAAQTHGRLEVLRANGGIHLRCAPVASEDGGFDSVTTLNEWLTAEDAAGRRIRVRDLCDVVDAYRAHVRKRPTLGLQAGTEVRPGDTLVVKAGEADLVFLVFEGRGVFPLAPSIVSAGGSPAGTFGAIESVLVPKDLPVGEDCAASVFAMNEEGNSAVVSVQWRVPRKTVYACFRDVLDSDGGFRKRGVAAQGVVLPPGCRLENVRVWGGWFGTFTEETKSLSGNGVEYRGPLPTIGERDLAVTYMLHNTGNLLACPTIEVQYEISMPETWTLPTWGLDWSRTSLGVPV